MCKWQASRWWHNWSWETLWVNKCPWQWKSRQCWMVYLCSCSTWLPCWGNVVLSHVHPCRRHGYACLSFHLNQLGCGELFLNRQCFFSHPSRHILGSKGAHFQQVQKVHEEMHALFDPTGNIEVTSIVSSLFLDVALVQQSCRKTELVTKVYQSFNLGLILLVDSNHVMNWHSSEWLEHTNN